MSVLYGGFLGRISMGEYPYSIWRFRRLPTGDPSVIIGVVVELESIGDSSLVEVELFMEMDFNQVRSIVITDL